MELNLFEIELQSQRLLAALRKPFSAHLKFHYLVCFIRSLLSANAPAQYLSYYLEFFPFLAELVRKKEFDYMSPSELSGVVNLIHSLRKIEGFSEKENIYSTLLEILTEAEHNTLALMDNVQPETKTADSIGYNSSLDSVNIVLIEIDESARSSPVSGVVHKLRLFSHNQSDPHAADTIEFYNSIDHTKTKIIEQVNHAVALAKAKCSKVGIPDHGYNFRFSFDSSGLLFSGASLGVGAASLAWNAILLIENASSFFRFKKDVVFTAEVDKQGNLLPLDPVSLQIKLETIFYSKFRKFVIPEDNIREAKEVLAQLNLQFPNRILQLIPLRNFENVFRNLDIVEVVKFTLPEKIRKHYRINQFKYNSTLLFCSLSIILFFLLNYLIPVLDRNPVSAGLENMRYLAFNKYGKVVWESPKLDLIDSALYFRSVNPTERILIDDIDEDGRNEIIYCTVGEFSQGRIEKRKVFCYSSGGERKWEYCTGKRDSVYGPEIHRDNSLVSGIELTKNLHTGKKELLVKTQLDEYFPFFLTKISAEGKFISEFYNPGYIPTINQLDINHEGRKEIFASGVNNDFDKSAAVAAFDPDFIAGKGPSHRYPRNFGNGLMKYYLLFPKTAISLFNYDGHTVAEDIRQDERGNISVWVRESGLVSVKGTLRPAYHLIYLFNQNMNCIRVGISSDFEARYKLLVAEGKLKPITDWAAFEDTLKAGLRWWDGDKFVNHSVINKYYLMAKVSTAKK